MIPPEWLPLLVAVHTLANVVWIGAIVSVAWLVGRTAHMADAPEIGRLALGMYRRFAVPAFVVSFVAGVARIVATPAFYLHAHWLHAKLVFAIGIIALHHIVGARAKRASKGESAAARGMGVLSAAILLAAAGAVFLVVFQASVIP